MLKPAFLVLLAITAHALSTASRNIDADIAPSTITDSLPVMCSDIVYTPSSGLREHTCLIPAIDLPDSQHATPMATGPSPAFSGTMTCSSSFTPPSISDATHFCSTLPASVTINATVPGYCQCHSDYYNTAYYEMCNCNLCGPVTFTSIGADCQAFVNSCFEGGLGGYRLAESPNMYTTLFERGSSHPALGRTACCTTF